MGPFWGGGAVSSFSPTAGCGVGYCWATDCCLLLCLFLRHWRSFGSVSCHRLPLRGYAIFSGSVACPAPAVELCLLGLRCLWCGAWFSTLCGAFLPGLRFWAASPAAGGQSVDSATVCLACLCAGSLGWAATLPLCSQCFSCTGWPAGVRWISSPCVWELP